MLRKYILFLLMATSLLSMNLFQPPESIWIVPGGGLRELLTEIFTEIQEYISDEQMDILILPITLAREAGQITSTEMEQLKQAAEEMRSEAQEACHQALIDMQQCHVEVFPIFSREDALNNQLVDQLLDARVDVILVPESTPAISILNIKGTILELGLGGALASGKIIVGFGEEAGRYWLSYNPNVINPFTFGAVSLKEPVTESGLSFALQNNLVETHFFAFDRLAYLLNGITLPDGTHVGVGIDAQTAAVFKNGFLLTKVLGDAYATIFDAETYHAADYTRYLGEDYFLSTRNIIVHLMERGTFDYDLNQRRWGKIPTPNMIHRDFRGLRLPQGTGSLFLSHSLSAFPKLSAVLNEFINLSGGQNATLLIVASGYPLENQALEIAEKFAAEIPVKKEILILPQLELLSSRNLAGYTGIILTMGKTSSSSPTALALIRTVWESGVNLILDGEAAALAGNAYLAAQQPNAIFTSDTKQALPGMNLITTCVALEPMQNSAWLEFISLAFHCPSSLAIRLPHDSILHLSSSEPRNIGLNAIVLLDLRSATMRPQLYPGLIFAHGLMDVYAPGETIEPLTADMASHPLHYPTPIITWPTETATPSPTPNQNTPTATLDISLAATQTSQAMRRAPTSTPTVEETTSLETVNPPPAIDPLLKQAMIFVAMIIVVVIALGVMAHIRTIRRRDVNNV